MLRYPCYPMSHFQVCLLAGQRWWRQRSPACIRPSSTTQVVFRMEELCQGPAAIRGSRHGGSTIRGFGTQLQG